MSKQNNGWTLRTYCMYILHFIISLSGLQDLVKPRDSGLDSSNRSELWQATRQQRSRDACQRSERYNHYNIQSCSFETYVIGSKARYCVNVSSLANDMTAKLWLFSVGIGSCGAYANEAKRFVCLIESTCTGIFTCMSVPAPSPMTAQNSRISPWNINGKRFILRNPLENSNVVYSLNINLFCKYIFGVNTDNPQPSTSTGQRINDVPCADVKHFILDPENTNTTSKTNGLVNLLKNERQWSWTEYTTRHAGILHLLSQ